MSGSVNCISQHVFIVWLKFYNKKKTHPESLIHLLLPPAVHCAPHSGQDESNKFSFVTTHCQSVVEKKQFPLSEPKYSKMYLLFPSLLPKEDCSTKFLLIKLMVETDKAESLE